MPQATIKMQQTQPLAQAPAPALRTAGAPMAAAAAATASAEADPLVGILSWVTLVAALAAAVLSYLAFSA